MAAIEAERFLQQSADDPSGPSADQLKLNAAWAAELRKQHAGAAVAAQ